MAKAAAVYPLPELFVRRLRDQFPSRADSLLRMLDEPARGRALRLNTLRTAGLSDSETKDFLDRFSSVLQGEVPWFPEGRYLAGEFRPGQDLYHACGAYYMQEASAMAPAALLDPQPGERILDLCAAPGGKSGQIAQRMQGRGVFVSNEIIPKRARILTENLRRLGVPNAVILNESPERLAAFFGPWFDKVLVDAPCSGEGMFRIRPEGRAEWENSPPADCALRQESILSSAAEMVRGGGTLVYSTCTYSEEENERLAESFLRSHPDFTLDTDAALPGVPGKGMLRLMPDVLRGEGQFAVRFRRSGTRESRLPGLETETVREWGDFMREQFLCPVPEAETVFRFRDACFLPPAACPALNPLHVLSLGIPLGNIRNGRFLPSHELFTAAFPFPFRTRIKLDPEQARTYLAGETLPFTGSEKGYACLLYGGFPLGGGKLSDGRIQNHLPKALRLPSATIPGTGAAPSGF